MAVWHGAEILRRTVLLLYAATTWLTATGVGCESGPGTGADAHPAELDVSPPRDARVQPDAAEVLREDQHPPPVADGGISADARDVSGQTDASASGTDALGCDGGTQDVADAALADLPSSPVADALSPTDAVDPADDQPDAPPCECTSGPCCDGCRILPPGWECAVQEYGCPSGFGCGSPVAARVVRRSCSGASAECDGPDVETDQWEVVTACGATESCVPGEALCVASPACPCPEGMVHAPRGSFPMGARPGEGPSGVEYPQHTVTVDAYCIDRHEVTAGDYVEFLNAVWPDQPCQYQRCVEWNWENPDDHVSLLPPPIRPGLSGWLVEDRCQAAPDSEPTASCREHPMTVVGWDGARQYCLWKGRRLPTEAEWERAAKGDTDRLYPWGDEPIQPGFANCDWQWCRDGFQQTSPVGSFPTDRSPAGCFDMAANVEEWVEDDFHSSYSGAPTDGSAWNHDPPGLIKVVRGGDFDQGATGLLTTRRGGTTIGNYFRGFRCAWRPGEAAGSARQ